MERKEKERAHFHIYVDWDEGRNIIYEGWNFNSGNYLFTTDTK